MGDVVEGQRVDGMPPTSHSVVLGTILNIKSSERKKKAETLLDERGLKSGRDRTTNMACGP